MEYEPALAPVVEAVGTRVWVVVTDCGLNGPIIHGVFTEPPQQEAVDRLVNETHIVQDYFHVRISGCTGYQNTSVLMGELDAPLNLGWGDD